MKFGKQFGVGHRQQQPYLLSQPDSLFSSWNFPRVSCIICYAQNYVYLRAHCRSALLYFIYLVSCISYYMALRYDLYPWFTVSKTSYYYNTSNRLPELRQRDSECLGPDTSTDTKCSLGPMYTYGLAVPINRTFQIQDTEAPPLKAKPAIQDIPPALRHRNRRRFHIKTDTNLTPADLPVLGLSAPPQTLTDTEQTSALLDRQIQGQSVITE